jgi:hypothetical protein
MLEIGLDKLAPYAGDVAGVADSRHKAPSK